MTAGEEKKKIFQAEKKTQIMGGCKLIIYLFQLLGGDMMLAENKQILCIKSFSLHIFNI